MLSLYVAQGKQYYYTNTPEDEYVLQQLFRLLCERINVKFVNHIGSVWTLMRAWMYSGGYETSHGDSWCVMFSLMLYLCHVMETQPQLKKRIEVALERGYIRAVIYGDDHIWCSPKYFRGLLSEAKYAEFCKEYLGMVIRDAVTTDLFFFRTVSEWLASSERRSFFEKIFYTPEVG